VLTEERAWIVVAGTEEEGGERHDYGGGFFFV